MGVLLEFYHHLFPVSIHSDLMAYIAHFKINNIRILSTVASTEISYIIYYIYRNKYIYIYTYQVYGGGHVVTPDALERIYACASSYFYLYIINSFQSNS